MAVGSEYPDLQELEATVWNGNIKVVGSSDILGSGAGQCDRIGALDIGKDGLSVIVVDGKSARQLPVGSQLYRGNHDTLFLQAEFQNTTKVLKFQEGVVGLGIHRIPRQ